MTEHTKTDDDMLQFMRDSMRDAFKSIDNKHEAFEAIHYLHNRISKVIEGLAERGALTKVEALDYSFSSCACAAFVYALEHNPIFDAGVFKDQLYYHYENVLQTANDTVFHDKKPSG